MQGVLAKKMNLFMQFSGGMSTQMLVSAVGDALADSSVHSLLLAIDSPGGEVDGTQQLADAINNSSKPTAAFIDGMGCSAALWIASQCDNIYAASDTTLVGSLGVIVQHADYSKANESKGKVVTHITTGKFKSAGSSDKPLSQDDRGYLQDRVDYMYTLFLNAVADGREMDPQAVDDAAGDAQVFFAQQAVDNGLIDGIASEAQVISWLQSDYTNKLSNPGASASALQNPQLGATMSVFKTFATEAEYNTEMTAAVERGRSAAAAAGPATEYACPEHGQIVKSEPGHCPKCGQMLKPTTAAAAAAAGITSERGRITGLESLALAGNHPELLKAMKADGTTTEAAAVKILAAEGTAQANAGANRRSEAQPPVPSGHADARTEAQAQVDAAAADAGGKKVDPVAYATVLRSHVAKAKAEGRTISVAQADAELAAADKK